MESSNQTRRRFWNLILSDLSTRGPLFWDPAKYQAAVGEGDKRGFQIFTHAIGR